MPLRLAAAGREDRARRVKVGSFVEPAEQLLVELRFSQQDVDVVDPPDGGVVAAGNVHERCNRMRGVGQEDVVVPRHDQQCAEDRYEHEPGDEGRGAREELSHRSPRDMPPSTTTVVPLTYAARAEARKHTTSPNS